MLATTSACLCLVFAPAALAPQSAPEPAASTLATEREITFAGHGGFELRGTLLVPVERATGGAPALLLLPGSGPTDRDGNQPPLLATDLLRQIAERLQADGYATLRFDKRAAHVYAESYLALSPDELRDFFGYDAFVGDARAALAALRAAEGVDRARVGVFGHSEGGLIGLSLASELGAGEGGVAALVLAATMGKPMADVLRYQIERSMKLLPENFRAKFMAELERGMAAIRETGRAPADLDAALAPLFNDSASKLLQVELALDPAALAKSYPGPVLVLQGELDVQVTADDNPALLAEAFAQRESGSCELVLVPAASHNLKPVEKETDPGFQGPVVPAALDGLAGWLARVLPASARER